MTAPRLTSGASDESCSVLRVVMQSLRVSDINREDSYDKKHTDMLLQRSIPTRIVEVVTEKVKWKLCSVMAVGI